MHAEPEMLVDEDDLQVSWLAGRGDCMVVSFTGIGHRQGEWQRIEFPKIASADGENVVVFVTDRRRTWYNGAGLIERITGAVLGLAGRLGIRRIATLGNSMGGYGAVLFANRLGAEQAIAFVPQFTMDDRVLPEPRWQDYKAGMPGFAVASLAECMGPPCRFFVLHGGRGQDRRHWLRFPAGGHIRHWVLPLNTHAAATRLHLDGRLDPLIAALLRDDQATEVEMLTRQGAHLRDPARPHEAWHLWVAGQSTRLGHRIAKTIVETLFGAPALRAA